jgi:methionyl-tRNA formyltransferase
LLPRWRGAAPIQRAIEAGDDVTGITIMQMDVGLDTGDSLLKASLPIYAADTSETLLLALATLGARTLLAALSDENALCPEKQVNEQATYARKLTKDEGRIDWSLDALVIARKIRAFIPWPVAYCDAFKVWQASVVPYHGSASPGSIINVSSDGIVVATGRDALRIDVVQCAGSVKMSVRDMLNAKSSLFLPGVIL